jgi:glc operon protein GlcG
MSLTLQEAEKIVDGALAKAVELDIKIPAAVLDAGGRLIAFKRMNKATWASVYGSQGKALASVSFGQTSGNLQARAEAPIIRGIAHLEGDHMIPSQGAVPIIRDGAVVGACGVGGGTAQEDEDCANAGLKAIS